MEPLGTKRIVIAIVTLIVFAALLLALPDHNHVATIRLLKGGKRESSQSDRKALHQLQFRELREVCPRCSIAFHKHHRHPP